MLQPLGRPDAAASSPKASSSSSAWGSRAVPARSSSPRSAPRATSCRRHMPPSQVIRSTARASSTSWASITPRTGRAASSGQASQRQGRGAPAKSRRWRPSMPGLGSTSSSSSRAASSGQPAARAVASCSASSPSPGPVSTRARGPGPSSSSQSTSWGAKRPAKLAPRLGEVAKSPRGPIRKRPAP